MTAQLQEPASSRAELADTAPQESPQRRKPGRPSKYTPERIESILTLLRAGNTRRAAAHASGVSVDTFCTWLAQYSEFSEACQKAESEAESVHVANILRAASTGSWQASAWWLERRRHQDWGRKQTLEVIQSVRELARSTNQDEEEAIRAAEEILREIRSASRA